MSSKQDVMNWIQENNKWGSESEYVSDFEKMLDTAIEKGDTTATTWIIGKGLTKDGLNYRLQWFAGLFLVDSISDEEAKKFNVEEMQTATLERKIKTIRFEEEKKSKISEKVWEYINNAWNSVSSAFPGSEDKEPISLEEINDFKMWTEKAKGVANKNEEDNQIIKNAEEAISVWEERKFDAPKRDVIVLLSLYGFAVIIKTISFFTGSVSNIDANPEQSFSILGTLISIIMLAGIIGYYWAYKAPVWLIDLRNSVGRRSLSDFFARIAKRAFHTTVYNVTTYSSGRVEKTPNILAGPIASFAIWCAYYIIFFQFIYIFTGVAVLKNYVFYKR